MNIPTLFKMFSLQMRAVLVDWLEEVQVQFKLLQVKCTSYQSISQGDLTTTILMSCVTGDSVQHHLYRRPVPCRGGALGHEVQAAAGGRGRHVPGLQGGRSLRASMLYPLLAPVLQGWRRGRAAAQPGQVRHRARPRRERPCASARVQVGRLCPLPVSCCWSPRFPFNTLSTIIGQEELINGSHLEVVQRSLRHDKRRGLEVKNS